MPPIKTLLQVTPLPPHAATLLMMARNNTSIPRMARDLRRRAGMPKSSTQAKMVLPPANQGNLFGPTLAAEQLEKGTVVDTVRVAVPAVLPVMLTGLVEPKPKVGVSMAPAGLEVMAAVSATLPVNPPLGVRVMVEVLPVATPGPGMITPDPVMVRPGGWMAVTVTISLLVPGIKLESPL